MIGAAGHRTAAALPGLHHGAAPLRRRRGIRLPRAWVLLGILLLGGPPSAQACALDGVPSLRADGMTAVPNRVVATRATLAHWAPFIFARSFPAGRPIRLTEDLRDLARSLPPEIVYGHWIWLLGDGQRAQGQTVQHRYARQGTYLITVAVALPRSMRTFTFDAALLQVR